MTGTGLVLQDNGTDHLPISANGPFTFAIPVGLQSSYNVVVSVPPNNPAQNCTVVNGSGTALGNVTNIQVSCLNAPTTDSWEWVNGPITSNQPGVYGTLGVPAATNLPGGRDSSATWTDAQGNFWLFGGIGYDSTQTYGVLNDLWEYSAGQWTWVGGSNLVDQPGVYGMQGVADPGNVPSARKGSVSWIDGSGNFWLFGGLDPSFPGDEYNDLWKYNAGEWTWVSGANVPEEPGVYGDLGVASATNVPGARVSAVGWIDATGALWLFGGDGYDSADSFGQLNDLWKFSSGEWTWMGGSNLISQLGVYGTMGTASATNVPGSRRLAVGWTDKAGDFWLFGGTGCASTTCDELNDLWEYSSGQWTWVGGSNSTDQPGVYGTLGTASASNFPGARDSALTLVDASGNVWLFAGEGYDSDGKYGQLNDLWKYSAGLWIWENGADLGNQSAIFGTKGTSAPGNTPGAVTGSFGWIDPSGDLWIFGGGGYASDGSGELNGLWKNTP
jgi:N-acetylneuraminic acid mutarotase